MRRQRTLRFGFLAPPVSGRHDISGLITPELFAGGDDVGADDVGGVGVEVLLVWS
jgi:hypothetical protein